MKINERIRKIREEKGLKIIDVYNRIKDQFGPKAIHYRTLQRIEAGETDPSEFSLYRISMGLGIKLKDLRPEERTLAKFIAKGDPKGYYDYPHTKARAVRLSTRRLKGFLPQELTLQGRSRTPIEKNIDPTGEKIYEKWIYGLKGEINCVVENEKYVIGKGDVCFFPAQYAHYLENLSDKETRCLIIYSPPYP